jgi:hypothetical protein
VCTTDLLSSHHLRSYAHVSGDLLTCIRGFALEKTNSINYQYDALNRLSYKIADKEPGGVLYGYDYTGRVTGLWADVDTATYAFGTTPPAAPSARPSLAARWCRGPSMPTPTAPR